MRNERVLRHRSVFKVRSPPVWQCLLERGARNIVRQTQKKREKQNTRDFACPILLVNVVYVWLRHSPTGDVKPPRRVIYSGLGEYCCRHMLYANQVVAAYVTQQRLRNGAECGVLLKYSEYQLSHHHIMMERPCAVCTDCHEA